jgi:hypothetical protein
MMLLALTLIGFFIAAVFIAEVIEEITVRREQARNPIPPRKRRPF